MKKITISAPGSIMLLGEHAVVYGHYCLVMACPYRISVTVSNRDDDLIVIDSDVFGKTVWRLGREVNHAALRFVVAAILACKPTNGLEIKITSKIDNNKGFGSSAAVVAATVAGITLLAAQATNITFAAQRQIMNIATAAVRQAQNGSGSGADICASVCGGILLYNTNGYLLRVDSTLDILSVYSGHKTPTPQMIDFIAQRYSNNEDFFKHLFNKSDELVVTATHCLVSKDLDGLGIVFNEAQAIMQSYDISSVALENCIKLLTAIYGVTGAKISGAGKGDCAIAVGNFTDDFNCSFPGLLLIKSEHCGLHIVKTEE